MRTVELSPHGLGSEVGHCDVCLQNCDCCSGLSSKKLDLSSKKLGLSPKRLGLLPKGLGLSFKRLDLSSRNLGLSSKRLGLSLRKLGVPSKVLGLFSKRLGLSPKSPALVDGVHNNGRLQSFSWETLLQTGGLCCAPGQLVPKFLKDSWEKTAPKSPCLKGGSWEKGSIILSSPAKEFRKVGVLSGDWVDRLAGHDIALSPVSTGVPRSGISPSQREKEV